MVKITEHNQVSLSSAEAIALIKSMFSSKLPQFILKEEYDLGTYAYSCYYVYGELEVEFGCEKTYFSHKIVFNNTEYYLFEYEDSLRLLPMSSKNIVIAFDILYEYITTEFRDLF